MNHPPVIHQPCGTIAKPIHTGCVLYRGRMAEVARLLAKGIRCFRCWNCELTIPWPHLDLQYQQTEPEGPPKNRILITVQQWAEDLEKPLSTEFPITCESTGQSERLSNQIVCGVRKLLENLNVQTSA